jgi:very-short-patch-repair endonuclease
MLPYDPRLKEAARALRGDMTDAEQRLWTKLRRKQLGHPFYRQKPLGGFVVDFYCHAARLVIEVDGGQHFTPEGREKDAARDNWLRMHGLTVLRFSNREVLENLEGVLERICEVLNPPRSPFTKGG